MDAAEFLRGLAGLTPEQKAAAAAILGGGPPPTESPKFSKALDQVAESDVDQVVAAAAQGIAFAAAHPADEHQAIQFLQQVAPVVASAAQVNANHRRKPIAHSLQVVVDYLLCDEASQRRSAAAKARRRARLTSTPAPAAPAASGAPAASDPGKGK